MADDGQCQRGRRCAGAQRTDNGQLIGAPITPSDRLCQGCLLRVTGAITALPRDYVELEIILDRHAPPTVKVNGTPAPPVPPRIDVMVLQATIDAELSAWAPPIAAQLGVTWDPDAMAAHRPGPRIHRAAKLLALNTVALVKLDPTPMVGWVGTTRITTMRTGLDAAITLLQVHRWARVMVQGDSGDVRLPVPCPRCEGLLMRPNGAGHVACQDCGAAWPESDYRRLCLVLAEDYRVSA